jgi:hypothetical protein
MMPDDLYSLTFREFSHKIEGYNIVHDQRWRQQLEASRFNAALIISSLAGKAIRPDDLVRFDWDRPKTINKIDPERFAQFIKAFSKLEHGK